MYKETRLLQYFMEFHWKLPTSQKTVHFAVHVMHGCNITK